MALNKLGIELVSLHLMKGEVDLPISNAVQKNKDSDSKIISKIAYCVEIKEIFVNESLYFKGVESAVWVYRISCYAVFG